MLSMSFMVKSTANEYSKLPLLYLTVIVVLSNALIPIARGEAIAPVQFLASAAIALCISGYYLLFDQVEESRGFVSTIHASVLVMLYALYIWQNPVTETSWLISLLIVAYAEEHMRGFLRIAFQVSGLGVILTHWVILERSFEDVFIFLLTVSSAYIFVIVYLKADLRSRSLRQRAEALSEQLQAANDQLTEFNRQAEELATAKERTRLAAELHDSLGHKITAASMQLQTIRRKLMGYTQVQINLLPHIETAVSLNREAMVILKSSVSRLNQDPLKGKNLPDALAELANQSTGTDISVSFGIHGDWITHPNGHIAHTLYRIAEEGLNNSIKHSEARTVSVKLTVEKSGKIIMEISDDGKGCKHVSGGFGLRGMHNRLQQVGGKLEIETLAGQGFTIRAEIQGDSHDSTGDL